MDWEVRLRNWDFCCIVKGEPLKASGTYFGLDESGHQDLNNLCFQTFFFLILTTSV